MKRFTPEIEVELEVAFHDVDMMRLVWHGNYYKYFEIARTKLLRAHDLTGETLIATGYKLVVTESKCRHPAPLRFGETFRVGAAFADVDYRLKIDYEIRSVDEGRRVAYGHTVLATIDGDGRLLMRTPDALLRRIRP